MFTVTGKVCILSAVFMIGLVVLWLCHVCCRSIWNFILVRLESSSRFSRILELSEINRERLRILPPGGGPVTQLAFLTSYMSASPARNVSSVSTGVNSVRHPNRRRTSSSAGRPNWNSLNGSAVIHHHHHQNGAATFVRNNSVLANQRSSLTRSSAATNGAVVPVSVPTTNASTVATEGLPTTATPQPPMSIGSGSEQTLCSSAVDPFQSVTLSIVSANSPPPSYHSTESIASQPATFQAGVHRTSTRDFPRQTSDSSETSAKSAPSTTVTIPPPPVTIVGQSTSTRRERLQRILESANMTSTSSSSSVAEDGNAATGAAGGTSGILAVVCDQPPPPDELPPSYDDLFGSSSSASDMSSPEV